MKSNRECQDLEKCPLKEQDNITLDNCPEGSECVVQGLQGASRARLSEMGLTSGTQVKIVHCGSCNGPILLEVRGYNLSLRKAEASCIFVQNIKNLSQD